MNSKYDFLKIQRVVDLSKKYYQKNVWLNKKLVFKIIEETWKKTKTDSVEEAFILIAGLLQIGGSNKGAVNKISFTFKNSTLSSKELTIILSKISKSVTIRQFAWVRRVVF